MVQAEKGKVKASPEIIKLWGTQGGRAWSFSIAIAFGMASLMASLFPSLAFWHQL